MPSFEREQQEGREQSSSVYIYGRYGHHHHPMSSSSMVEPLDDSDGEDEQERWGRPSKKTQLHLISALMREEGGGGEDHQHQQQHQLGGGQYEQSTSASSPIRYLLPTEWFEAWEDYCTFPQSRSDPGPIEFATGEGDGSGGGGGGGGGGGIEATTLVSGQVWNLLVGWYGLSESHVSGGGCLVSTAIALVDQENPSDAANVKSHGGMVTGGDCAPTLLQVAYKLSQNGPISYTTVPIDGLVADLYGKLVRLALDQQAASIKATITTAHSLPENGCLEGWRIDLLIIDNTDPPNDHCLGWLDDLIGQVPLAEAGLIQDGLVYCLDSSGYHHHHRQSSASASTLAASLSATDQ